MASRATLGARDSKITQAELGGAMRFHLEIREVTLVTNAGRHGTDDVPSPAPGLVTFTVHPKDHEHLDLETGETFTNPRYAKLREHKGEMIGAQLSVVCAQSDADFEYNVMLYHKGIEAAGIRNAEPASMTFTVHVSAAEFAELLASIRGGLLPSGIGIRLKSSLKDDVLKFGWEPDGSGMSWNNKSDENKAVPISHISFQYELRKEELNAETLEPEIVSSDREKSTSLTNIARRVEAIETYLNSISKMIAIIMFLAVAAAIPLVFK